MHSLFSIFWIFLKLGLTSFGGPMAHLAYFQREFVDKRQWLTAPEYAEIIALCNFLPGPASSQVGMALGYQQRGLAGSLMAFLGFTLPSALIMLVCASLMLTQLSPTVEAALHGLKLLAVVVVADAVLKMLKTTATDRFRQIFVLLVALLMLLLNGGMVQIGVLLVSGFIGYLFISPSVTQTLTQTNISTNKTSLHYGWLVVLGLVALPVLGWLMPELAWIDALFRVGATVMGGGHVVLPMLSAEVAIYDAMPQSYFLAGYSLAQAVPGPMFTLATYLGVILGGGIWGGLLATLLIFLPGWLLLISVLPIWSKLRTNTGLSCFVSGIHIGVVGLLMATLYRFVWQGTVTRVEDMAAILAIWGVLVVLKQPVWVAILVAVIGGLLIGN